MRTRPCVFPLRFQFTECPGTGFQKVSVGVGRRENHELSKPQRVATSSRQPCSSVSDGEAGVEPRLETLKLPDILTSDGELQQPGPGRSRYGRLLKPRKELNDYC
ncbi:hypothetical protein TNCV_3830041 [Trichonephila clavipes]|nr:hypothetical protein TNCV_3830041 [Trichonephila clavipes]